jgi:hypothetical protein
MDLLKYYFFTLFPDLYLPTPTEICADGGQIKSYCFGLLYGLNFFVIAAIILPLALSVFKKFKLSIKCFLFLLPIATLGFWVIDYILKQLSEVANFGSDAFVVTFYLWWFFAILCFYFTIIFPNSAYLSRKKTILIFFVGTILATISFVFTGRGTIEHITPLIGGLLAKFTLEFLYLSFIAKIITIFFVFGFVFWLSKFLYFWVVTGVFNKLDLKATSFLVIIFSIISLWPIASLPFGEYINKKDVESAQKFIDEIIKKTTKKKFENGEYPKVISDMFEVKSDYPKLLKRHDYLSFGTKGSYYFSRKDKFCFVFQNPARKLGYYSITSTKPNWKFSSYKGSLEEEYINVCDEQYAGSDNIIGGSLGLTDPYSEIEEMAAKVGAETRKPAITLKANQVLKTILDEYGKKDPTIFDQPK